MLGEVDLIVPVKALGRAKSRLGSAAFDRDRRAALALAFALDTVTAALDTKGVRRILAVTSDPLVKAELGALGVPSTSEPAAAGLNEAARRGAQMLRQNDPGATIGVLQADLPALRPVDLATAIASGAGRRAFCADRRGTGTTLLLSAAGEDLDPRFGPQSAFAHADTGAVALWGRLPSLRCDVDTLEDLQHAIGVGLGRYTTRQLGSPADARFICGVARVCTYDDPDKDIRRTAMTADAALAEQSRALTE